MQSRKRENVLYLCEKMLENQMKKILIFVWLSILLLTLIYDAYLNIQIHYFGYSAYNLKSYFVFSTMLYSIITFPIGFLLGLLFSIFGIVIKNYFLGKIFTFLSIIINYYFLFVWIPDIWRKSQKTE